MNHFKNAFIALTVAVVLAPAVASAGALPDHFSVHANAGMHSASGRTHYESSGYYFGVDEWSFSGSHANYDVDGDFIVVGGARVGEGRFVVDSCGPMGEAGGKLNGRIWMRRALRDAVAEIAREYDWSEGWADATVVAESFCRFTVDVEFEWAD